MKKLKNQKVSYYIEDNIIYSENDEVMYYIEEQKVYDSNRNLIYKILEDGTITDIENSEKIGKIYEDGSITRFVKDKEKEIYLQCNDKLDMLTISFIITLGIVTIAFMIYQIINRYNMYPFAVLTTLVISFFYSYLFVERPRDEEVSLNKVKNNMTINLVASFLILTLFDILCINMWNISTSIFNIIIVIMTVPIASISGDILAEIRKEKS